MTLAILALLAMLQTALPGVPPESMIPRDDDQAAAYLTQLGDGFGSWNAWEPAFQCYREAMLRKPGVPRTKVRIARALYRINRGDEALQQSEQALEALPEDPEAIRVYAGVHLAAGQIAPAAKVLQQLLETNPDDVDALRLYGTAQAQMGQLDEGEKTLQKAVDGRPDDPETYLQLAKLTAQRKQYDKAAGYLRRVVELAPDREDGYAALLQVYLAQNKVPEAVIVSRAALRISPRDPQLLLAAGKLHLQAGLYREASGYLRAAMDTGEPPAVVEAAPVLGQYYLQTGQWESAATVCRLGLATDLKIPPLSANPSPDEVSARRGQVEQLDGARMQMRSVLAQACMAQRDWSGAADVVAPVVATHPENAQMWMRWFDMQLRAGRSDGVRRTLRGLLDQFADQPGVYGQAITWAVANGRTAEIIPLLAEAYTNHPDQGRLGLLYYTCLRRTGRTGEARSLLADLRSRFAKDPMVVREVGVQAFEDNDWPGAIRLLAPLMDAHKIDPEAVSALAWAYELTGDYLRAARAFSVLASPKRPEVFMDIARQYVNVGRFAEAAALYDKVLAQRPNMVGAMLGKARAVGNSGRLQDCLPLFEKVLQHDPSNAIALRGLIIAYQMMGKTDKAQVALQRYYKYYKGPVAALIGASVASMTADWQQMADLYIRKLAKYPSSSLLNNRLAMLYGAANPTGAPAEKQYQLAADAEPNDWFPRWQLAELYRDRGEFSRAAMYWRDVVNRMPNEPIAGRLWLSGLDASQGADVTLDAGLQWLATRRTGAGVAGPLVDYAQSVGRLDELQSRLTSMMTPVGATTPPAHQTRTGMRDALGLALMARGKTADARRWYELAVKDDPTNPLWQQRAGEACERAGDLSGASRYLVRSAHLDASSMEQIALLARVEAASGQAVQAIRRLRQALTSDSATVSVLTGMIAQYTKQGLLPRVLPQLRRMVDGDAAHHVKPLPQGATPAAKTVLAFACEEMGLTQEAARRYAEVLAVSGDMVVARNGLRRLNPDLERTARMAALGRQSASNRRRFGNLPQSGASPNANETPSNNGLGLGLSLNQPKPSTDAAPKGPTTAPSKPGVSSPSKSPWPSGGASGATGGSFGGPLSPKRQPSGGGGFTWPSRGLNR